jgi:5-methylcytosine-specific restriction enzyme B
MSYYPQLKLFIEQAKTDNLKTKHFDSEYLGTEVKVSFGQGNTARIPWISFLKPPNTTSNGIYPVYLYFKEFKLLILAFGISETNKPGINWVGLNKKTIKDYFNENYSQKPDRYGNSYIFKIYKSDKLPNEITINEDLEEIIKEYKDLLNNSNSIINLSRQNNFNLNSFKEKTVDAGLIFSSQLIQRFIASLCTKPFVICSGLSGSGKTKLAQAFAQWISEDKSQYAIVPVGADWTNREPLLGYPNALDKEEYVSPENGVLDLMLKAKQNIENTEEPTKPYFLILDEMNLSHVERYFADFLSTMESGDNIPLHKILPEPTKDLITIPQTLKLPKNLFIIGTVNIDETTYMFSPKVLDRANTIEFRLTEKDLEDFIASDIKLDMDILTAQGANMGESFMAMALQETDKNLESTKEDLKLFFSELKKSGSEFGYRTASEIGRLMYMLKELGEDGDTLLDIAIMQKLLPKLHGSRNKLTKVLPILGGFCLTDNSKIKEDYLDRFVSNSLTEEDLKTDQKIKYKISFEKICRMYKNAVENGFASYAEA